MNILIAYATKTGTTQKAASLLAEALAQKGVKADLFDLSVSSPDVTAYDAAAVGGSIRMGALHKLARRFIAANEAALLKMPAGFFCCRCSTDDTRSLLAPQIGSGLAGHAAQVTALGGELDLSKQKGLDRLIVKMVSGQNNAMRPDGVSPERVAAFVEALMEAASGV